MKLVIAFFCVVLANTSHAQIYHPVTWDFKVVKIGKDLYQIHLKSVIEQSWHIYSQIEPLDAIGIPTKIVFNKNTSIQLNKMPIEIGRLEKITDKSTGISDNQYSGEVDFVQTFKMTKKSKTNISGIITFQACNSQRCLQPEDLSFSIPIK